MSNIARTAAASAAASARVDFAQRVTNQWLSPIFLPLEVIAQSHPDSRLWGNHGRQRGETHDRLWGDLVAATGEVHMTVDSSCAVSAYLLPGLSTCTRGRWHTEGYLRDGERQRRGKVHRSVM